MVSQANALDSFIEQATKQAVCKMHSHYGHARFNVGHVNMCIARGEEMRQSTYYCQVRGETCLSCLTHTHTLSPLFRLVQHNKAGKALLRSLVTRSNNTTNHVWYECTCLVLLLRLLYPSTSSTSLDCSSRSVIHCHPSSTRICICTWTRTRAKPGSRPQSCRRAVSYRLDFCVLVD